MFTTRAKNKNWTRLLTLLGGEKSDNVNIAVAAAGGEIRFRFRFRPVRGSDWPRYCCD